MFKTHLILPLVTITLLASQSQAAIRLNEIYRNPEDLVDGDDGVGREFIELISDTGGVESLAGLTLVEISGQDFIGAEKTGTILRALDLSPFSTGTNGLFLWRDTADVLLPAPDAATTVAVELFDPNLFDDNVTYALVEGFSGAVGDDLDTNTDGMLDDEPWASVVDSVGVQESGEPGFTYSGQIGGVDFPALGFGNDAFARLPDIGEWFLFDSGSGEEDPNYFGPFYANDPGDNLTQSGQTFPFGENSTFYPITPGSVNAAVPEPASATLLVFMGTVIGAMLRRRR